MSIYDFVPSALRGPIQTFFVDEGSSFSGTLSIPASLEQIYVKVSSPNGSSFVTILPTAGSQISHTFYKAKTNKKVFISSPGCSSGDCDLTVNNPTNWATYDDDDDVSVRLCGTGNFSTININEGILEITNGADVSVQNINLNAGGDNEIIVYQGGSLTITGWFNPSSDIYNYGSIDIAGLNLNANANIENYGDIIVSANSGSTSLNGDIENYGSFTIQNDVNHNSSCEFENNCSYTIKGKLTLNGKIENYGYVLVEDFVRINGSGRLDLEDGAMASFENSLWLDGKIEGDGTTSLVKVTGRSDANNSGDIKGDVEYCDADGIENFPNNTIRQGAVAACNVVIPTSSCNPEGNGTNVVTATDGDGVADEIDEYPNDASRASNSYYPSANTFGNLAFEDLWPAFGDYDFNDLVVDYRYQSVLNANNGVVDLTGTFVTKAIGGSLPSGFGIQLDVASNTVASVSGTQYFENLITTNSNGTEARQSNATVIVYDEASQVLINSTGNSFVNTVSYNPSVAPVTNTVTISFNSPEDPANLGSAPYNPFIFVDQKRGREVHLPGEAPTDLADNTLFGTIDDNTSVGGDAYKSSNNLPWALNIIGGFQYPEEKNDISATYSNFASWAQSGGASNANWYEDLQGNINNGLLYSAN
jgi:LruC domain-containing protein